MSYIMQSRPSQDKSGGRTDAFLRGAPQALPNRQALVMVYAGHRRSLMGEVVAWKPDA